MATKGSRTPKQTTDSAVTVVLHRLGDTWNALAARRGADGRPQVTASHSVQRTDRSSLNRWVEEHAPGRILVVVPASRIICRSFTLPDAGPDRLEAALQLQAEAHLLGAVPPHRLGLAVLPRHEAAGADGGEPTRTGLLVGWPEDAGAGASAIDRPLDGHTSVPAPTYVADVAGLAALIDGLRPADPVLWLDRAEGAVALAVTQPSAGLTGSSGGIIFRATREEFVNEAEWRRDIVRVVSETLLGAGQPALAVRDAATALVARLEQADGAALLAPDAMRERAAALVGGTKQDPGWWDKFGIAVGVLLCLDGELEPLTRMQADRTVVKPTAVARMAAALSRPRTAVALALLGLVAVAFGPLALSRLRGAVLQMKVPDQAALRKQNLEDAKRRAMYTEMGRQTLPMSKLLADLANSTPEGVTVSSLVIDRGSGLRLEGTAGAAKGQTGVDRLGAMTRMMNETGVFALADYDREPGDGLEAVEFTVTATVADSFREYQWEPEQDFNVKSLAMRRFGKETTPGVEVPPEPPEEAESTVDGEASARASTAPVVEVSPPAGSPTDSALTRAETDGGAASVGEAASSEAPKRSAATGGPSRRTARGDAAADAGATQNGEGKTKPEAPPTEGSAGSDSGSQDGGSANRARADRRPLGRRGEGESSGRAAGAASRSDQPVLGGAPTIPDPLTDEAIAAMSRAEAQEMLAKIAKARQSADLDEATQARLKAEFDKLMARMKEAK